MKSLFKTFWIYLVFSAILFIVDFKSKFYVVEEIGIGYKKSFIHRLIQLNVVENTGGAFSILKDYPMLFIFIGIINAIIFFYLIIFKHRGFNTYTNFGFSFILGGILGNLKDRFLYGAVIDFIDLQFIDFAVFNFADVFIDIGIIFIVIGYFLDEKKKKLNEK